MNYICLKELGLTHFSEYSLHYRKNSFRFVTQGAGVNQSFRYSCPSTLFYSHESFFRSHRRNPPPRNRVGTEAPRPSRRPYLHPLQFPEPQHQNDRRSPLRFRHQQHPPNHSPPIPTLPTHFPRLRQSRQQRPLDPPSSLPTRALARPRHPLVLHHPPLFPRRQPRRYHQTRQYMAERHVGAHHAGGDDPGLWKAFEFAFGGDWGVDGLNGFVNCYVRRHK